MPDITEFAEPLIISFKFRRANPGTNDDPLHLGDSNYSATGRHHQPDPVLSTDKRDLADRAYGLLKFGALVPGDQMNQQAFAELGQGNNGSAAPQFARGFAEAALAVATFGESQVALQGERAVATAAATIFRTEHYSSRLAAVGLNTGRVEGIVQSEVNAMGANLAIRARVTERLQVG